MKRFDYLRSEREQGRRRRFTHVGRSRIAPAAAIAAVLAAVLFVAPHRGHRVLHHVGRSGLPALSPHGLPAYTVTRRRVAQASLRFTRHRRPLPPVRSRAPVRQTIAPVEHVLGVAVGERSQAIVASGTRTRIVSVGDIVGGRRIVAISLQGLHLDGVRDTVNVER